MLISGAVGEALFESGKHFNEHLKWYCLVICDPSGRSAEPECSIFPIYFLPMQAHTCGGRWCALNHQFGNYIFSNTSL